MKRHKKKINISKPVKGMGPVMLGAVVIVSGLILEVFLVSNVVIQSNVVNRIAREMSVIDAINAMEFLKRSMKEGVKHSAYKASYDVMNRGGYNSIPEDESSSDCVPYWREYSDTTEYTKDMFDTNFETVLGNAFECYGTSYSSAYQSSGIWMATPLYSECGTVEITSVEDNKYAISIKNDCDSGLEVSKEFTKLEEGNANFEDEVVIGAWDLIQSANTEFTEERQVLDAIQTVVSEIDCRSITVREDDCNYEGEESDVGTDLIRSECGNWKSRLLDLILLELEKTDMSGAELSFSVSTGDLNAEYTVTGCTICEEFEVETDECVEEPSPEEPEPEEPPGPEEPPLPPYRIIKSPLRRLNFQEECSGTCLDGVGECRAHCEKQGKLFYGCSSATDCDVCCCKCQSPSPPPSPEEPEPEEPETPCTKKTITRYKTRCSYNFDADADVLVTVKTEEGEEDSEYPVYNSDFGKTEWIRLPLRFRILDGNLGTLNAKKESCSEISYC